MAKKKKKKAKPKAKKKKESWSNHLEKNKNDKKGCGKKVCD